MWGIFLSKKLMACFSILPPNIKKNLDYVIPHVEQHDAWKPRFGKVNEKETTNFRTVWAMHYLPAQV